MDEYTARWQADADFAHEENMHAEAYAEGVAAERERWKAMMLRAIATCFDQQAHHEVMSDPKHFAAEALRA